MNRTEFFEKVSGLDEQRLRTAPVERVLVQCRPVRERIEAELQPPRSGRSGGSYPAGDRK